MSRELLLGLFVLGTLVLWRVSREAIRRPRSHGFYRFFAWECLLGLGLLNVTTWFRDPWAWHQLIAWSLLSVSLLLVFTGLRLLQRLGRPTAARQAAALLPLEKTSQLVTVGVYRYIRHPLYSSLLCLAWGLFFKSPSWPEGLLAAVATLCLVVTARVEERENLEYFGDSYRDYMSRSKRFIPFLF